MTTNIDKDEEAVIFAESKEVAVDSDGEAEEFVATSACCSWWRFNGATAQGYNILGTAEGPVIMSNVFLSTALIYLASEEVGCVVKNAAGEEVVADSCDKRVYGAFRPAALVTNIAAISGVMSALFMPIIGALIDYTPHRWNVGVWSAVLITLVQVVQCFTYAKTWFPMAILQAITGFFYQVQSKNSFEASFGNSMICSINSMLCSPAFSLIQFCQVMHIYLISPGKSRSQL